MLPASNPWQSLEKWQAVRALTEAAAAEKGKERTAADVAANAAEGVSSDVIPDQTIESFLAFTLANALSYEHMQKSVRIIDFYRRESLSFQQRMDKIC